MEPLRLSPEVAGALIDLQILEHRQAPKVDPPARRAMTAGQRAHRRRRKQLERAGRRSNR